MNISRENGKKLLAIGVFIQGRDMGSVVADFKSRFLVTHFFNHQSRRAIERLGAKQDGILRSHQIAPNGTLRDTVVYSITAAEWPTVRAHLNYQLNDKPR